MTASWPAIVAHRGASCEAPENTLAAFRLAWELGAAGIEGDFHQTADGAIVCLHDADTRRVAGVDRRVSDCALAELRQLEVGGWRGPAWRGEPIPTLAEVLATVPPGRQAYLELKGSPAMVPAFLAGLAEAGLTPAQVVVMAFDQAVLRRVRDLAPQWRCFWLTGFKDHPDGRRTPDAATALATLRDLGAVGINADYRGLTEAWVQAVRAGGRECHAWTVDDPEAASRLAAWGVQSLTTNDPRRLLALTV